jgi:putative ATP-binding cassette transporter
MPDRISASSRRSQRLLKAIRSRIDSDGVEDAPWDQILSGGEKQRLAFARVLLHRPNIVVLDEATSALDPASQKQMMELLTKELGATTIVSVAHRPELESFHSRKITFERQSGGARLITDKHLTHKPIGRRLIKRLIKPWRRRPRHTAPKLRSARDG